MSEQLQIPAEFEKFQEQFETINEYGITPEQIMKVIDGIIHSDLSDKNYQIPERPLAEAEDKQKEADRILNNYTLTLASLVENKENGKDDEIKSTIKLSIIIGAAKTALTMLGFRASDVDIALGLTEADE
jgi:sporulation-control protein spo0M